MKNCDVYEGLGHIYASLAISDCIFQFIRPRLVVDLTAFVELFHVEAVSKRKAATGDMAVVCYDYLRRC